LKRKNDAQSYGNIKVKHFMGPIREALLTKMVFITKNHLNINLRPFPGEKILKIDDLGTFFK
jgi:hypothetical protein